MAAFGSHLYTRSQRTATPRWSGLDQRLGIDEGEASGIPWGEGREGRFERLRGKQSSLSVLGMGGQTTFQTQPLCN